MVEEIVYHVLLEYDDVQSHEISPTFRQMTGCTTKYRPIVLSERVSQAKQFSGKRKEKRKFGHGPQRGARHQDILTD
jgi:hypothetical protein